MDPAAILPAAHEALADRTGPRRPELWDGHAAERVAAVMAGEPAPRPYRPAPAPRAPALTAGGTL